MPLLRQRRHLFPHPAIYVPRAAGGGGGGGGSPTFIWTAKAIADHAFASNNHTFSAQAIGTASADRRVIFGVGHDSEVTASATVGGIAATQVVATTDGGSGNAAFWIANVPSGTTADIVITGADNIGLVGIQVGVATGINATATATGALDFGFLADPHNLTQTIPSGGFAVYFAVTTVPNAAPTWNNLADNRNEVTLSTTLQALMASSTVAGSAARGVSGYNFSGLAAVGACWGA